MTTTSSLHCIAILLALMAVCSFRLSAAERESLIDSINTKSSSISTLVLELMNRMDEMERRHENEVNILHSRIEALENLHASDLQQTSDRDMKIKKPVHPLNPFVNKQETRQGRKNEKVGNSSDTENRPRMKSSHGRITRVVSSPNTGIGFHAILDHVVANAAFGQSIAFSNVITNLGNAYSPNSGIFRCTQAGLYVFSSTLSLITTEKVDAQIQRNGNMISSGTCGNDDHWSSCTATAVVELSEGDEVWVAITNKHQAGSHLEPHFSAFSGFLLPWPERH